MNILPSFAWLRKLASLLLVVCFVLPLSTCSVKQAPGNPNAVATETHMTGYSLVADYSHDFQTEIGKSLLGLMAVFLVFFLPAACLLLSPKWQAIVHLVSAFPAGYFLFLWVVVWSTRAEFGGILAISCWTILFLLSCFRLVQIRRRG